MLPIYIKAMFNAKTSNYIESDVSGNLSKRERKKKGKRRGNHKLIEIAVQ